MEYSITAAPPPSTNSASTPEQLVALAADVPPRLTCLETIQVQRFDNLYDPTPSATLALGTVLDHILQGPYQDHIRRLRRIFAQSGEEAYAHAKRKLPQVTFAGTFHPTRAKAHLRQHSGIVHADVDHLSDLRLTKLTIIQDPTVVYCFTSPRGDGLKYGVLTHEVDTDAAYQHAWQCIADAHHARHGVTWDPTGKDICRLCFVSADPACYVNPAAQDFPIPAIVIPPSPPRPLRQTPLPADRRAFYAQHALDRAMHLIEVSVPGQQHAARRKASYLLGGYIAGGLLSTDEASAALEAAVERTAKNVRRAMQTIRTGLQAGAQRPITAEALEADWEAYRAAHPRRHGTTQYPPDFVDSWLGPRHTWHGIPIAVRRRAS